MACRRLLTILLVQLLDLPEILKFVGIQLVVELVPESQRSQLRSG